MYYYVATPLVELLNSKHQPSQQEITKELEGFLTRKTNAVFGWFGGFQLVTDKEADLEIGGHEFASDTLVDKVILLRDYQGIVVWTMPIRGQQHLDMIVDEYEHKWKNYFRFIANSFLSFLNIRQDEMKNFAANTQQLKNIIISRYNQLFNKYNTAKEFNLTLSDWRKIGYDNINPTLETFLQTNSNGIPFIVEVKQGSVQNKHIKGNFRQANNSVFSKNNIGTSGIVAYHIHPTSILKQFLYKKQGIQFLLNDVREVVNHEMRHFVIWLMGGLMKYGLGPRETRNKQPYNMQHLLPHPARNHEFQTNIGTLVDILKTAIEMMPIHPNKNEVVGLIKYCVGSTARFPIGNGFLSIEDEQRKNEFRIFIDTEIRDRLLSVEELDKELYKSYIKSFVNIAQKELVG